MPGIILHTLFANELLTRWRRNGGGPFDLDCPLLRAAYFRGAVAPDMGYYPGGVDRLSTVAHGERAEDIAWDLVKRSRSEIETAYGLGWVTHVVADSHLHPHIDAACADAVSGDGEPMDALRSHIRLELGLDIRFLAANQRLVRDRWRMIGPAPPMAFVAGALSSADAQPFHIAEVRRCDVALSRFVSVALRYTSLLVKLGDRFLRPLRQGEQSDDASADRARWRTHLRIESLAAPLSPDADLVRITGRMIDDFPTLFGLVPADELHAQRYGWTDRYEEVGPPRGSDPRGSGPDRTAA